jgi:hypothetical protein
MLLGLLSLQVVMLPEVVINHVKDNGKSILIEGGQFHINLTFNAQPKRTPKEIKLECNKQK